ncbi:hypothetical protein ACFCVQ_13935 [Bacillus thuringiensis]|uniref:hypothetical protein n=1 Tax=Bacillus cereus group TaxID=86661 RepID=UPI00159B8F4B|nr:hypothetical protein [Bacillus cereus]
MIKSGCIGDIQIDREWQIREGIKKLEITLKEEGEVSTFSIERYPFTCKWRNEDEGQ